MLQAQCNPRLFFQTSDLGEYLLETVDGDILPEADESLLLHHEYFLRIFPLQRKVKRLFVKGHLKTVYIICLPHCLKPLRHSLRIAMDASKTDLGASRYRIPCGLGPFDCGIYCHISTPKNILGNFDGCLATFWIASREKQCVKWDVFRVEKR